MIDEFTRLYDGVLAKRVQEDIFKDWKIIAQDEDTTFGAVLSGHDITPEFLNLEGNRNAMAILDKKKFTYLDKEDAKDLIVKPVESNVTYVGASVKRIMEYTSRSPYYIQIFCHKLIEYIIHKHSRTVTVTDVDTVAQRFYSRDEDRYSAFNSIADFDNLINSGVSSRWYKYKDDQIIDVLRCIAELTKDERWCKKSDVIKICTKSFKKDKGKKQEFIGGIIDNLFVREVIQLKTIEGETFCQIRVLLFKLWLINNPE